MHNQGQKQGGRGQISVCLALLLALLLVCGGCGEQRVGRGRFPRIESIDPVEVSVERRQDPKEEPETEPATATWLTVTREQSVIASLLQAARLQADRDYQAILKRFEAGPPHYLEPEDQAIIDRRRSDIQAHLTPVARSVAGRKTTALAAASLVYLGDQSHRATLVRALERGNKLTRMALLEALTFGEWRLNEPVMQYRAAINGDAALTAQLRKQLADSDPEVVVAAIQACGALQVADAGEPILQAAQKLNPQQLGAAMHWLAQSPLTPELLEFALARTPRTAEQLKQPWNSALLGAFARQGQGDLRAQARAELKRLVELRDQAEQASPEQDAEHTYDPHDWMEWTLAESATAEDLPWLRARSSRELMPAILRLEGPAGRQRLLQALGDPALRNAAVIAASGSFRDTNDQELLAALVRAANAEHAVLPGVCQALHTIGGAEALAKHRRIIRRLEPESSSYYLGLIDDADLPGLAQRAVARGLLTEAEAKAALAKLQAHDAASPRDAGLDSSYVGLLRLLEAAGLVTTLNTESSTHPPRHDRLLAQLAAHSRGLFRPTDLSEDEIKKEQEEEADLYTVRFLHGTRAYLAILENEGVWYDLDRTVLMVSRALQDAGVRERFVPLYSDSETVTLVFGDPEKLTAAAEEFHLTLDHDLTGEP